jgi:hypothetical protein
MQQRPQDTGQRAWIALNDTPSLLASLHHLNIKTINGLE